MLLLCRSHRTPGRAQRRRDPAVWVAVAVAAGAGLAGLPGASDRAIAHQTRHRSLATLGGYVRLHTAWQDNAATQLGL